jgi:hypothetical protein
LLPLQGLPVPEAQGSPDAGFPLPFPPALPLPPAFPLLPAPGFPLSTPFPLPLPFEFPFPFPFVPEFPFPFPLPLPPGGVLVPKVVARLGELVRTIAPFSTIARSAGGLARVVTSICSIWAARSDGPGGNSPSRASRPAIRLTRLSAFAGPSEAWAALTATSKVPLLAFIVGIGETSPAGSGGMAAGRRLPAGTGRTSPSLRTGRSGPEPGNTEAFLGKPSMGAASPGWAVRETIAQAHRSAARRLARLSRPSWIPTRTKALLSPPEESRLGLIVGWTTNGKPKLVNNASGFVNHNEVNVL